MVVNVVVMDYYSKNEDKWTSINSAAFFTEEAAINYINNYTVDSRLQFEENDIDRIISDSFDRVLNERRVTVITKQRTISEIILSIDEMELREG